MSNGRILGVVNKTTPDFASGIFSINDVYTKLVDSANVQWPGILVNAIMEGGTKIQDGDYNIHIFTSSQNLTVSQVGTLDPAIEYIVVGGGGGGGSSGSNNAGGGAAGGFRTGNLTVNTTGTYSITVGAAGAGAGGGTRGSKGGDSSFLTITSTGGGGGGGGATLGDGEPGGSGGGAGFSTAGGVGNTPPVSPPQGNDGGKGGASGYGSGGGGGAGQIGLDRFPNTTSAVGGRGGNGISVSWVTPGYGTPGPTPGRWFAGGGGGGGWGSPTRVGIGGAGGGAPGVSSTDAGPTHQGVTNTGGGGGGQGGPASGSGGSGGSGVVIIRYKAR